jgi:hypothetical protein
VKYLTGIDRRLEIHVGILTINNISVFPDHIRCNINQNGWFSSARGRQGLLASAAIYRGRKIPNWKGTPRSIVQKHHDPATLLSLTELRQYTFVTDRLRPFPPPAQRPSRIMRQNLYLWNAPGRCATREGIRAKRPCKSGYCSGRIRGSCSAGRRITIPQHCAMASICADFLPFGCAIK